MNQFISALVVGVCLAYILFSCSANDTTEEEVAYLFAYFTGNGPGEEQVHYALSTDGYTFRALNGNQSVLDSKEISISGGVRDPHLLRGEDGNFYMVLADLYVPEMGWPFWENGESQLGFEHLIGCIQAIQPKTPYTQYFD